MSTSSCCFLTCIQISQEAGQVVQYSHLFQNFPQFTVIHTVKGFGIVNKAEIDIFLELSCFFDDPADVGNLISGSSALSKTSLNIWKFTVHILLKPVCSVYPLKGRPMGLSSGAHSGVLFIRHIFLGFLPPRSHFSAPHFVSWHYLLPRKTTCTWLLGLRSAGGIQFRTGAVENVFQRLDITSGKGAISAQLLSHMILNPLPPSSDFRMPCKRNSRGFRARQPHHWAVTSPLWASIFSSENGPEGLYIQLSIAQSLKRTIVPSPPSQPWLCLLFQSGWVRLWPKAISLTLFCP